MIPFLSTKMRVHNVMIVAVVVQAFVVAFIGLARSFPMFAVAVFFLGCGKGLFDPASLTVVRKEICPESRCHVAAIIELSWGLSSGVGIPAMGFLMGIFWQLPFFVCAGLCAFTAIALFASFRPRDGVVAKKVVQSVMPEVQRTHSTQRI